MKTSLLFLAGYALAILVFFGGKLYAESLTSSPPREDSRDEVRTLFKKKSSGIGLGVVPSNSSTTGNGGFQKVPTHLLVKILKKRAESEGKKDFFLGEASYFQVNMATASLKLSGNQAVITTEESEPSKKGTSTLRITTILNYHDLMSPGHSAGTFAQGFVDVIEVSGKGRLLSLNTYPIQAVELVHSARNEK